MMITFDSYQLEAWDYANYDRETFYPVLGLCGESGEVAEKCKKLSRDVGIKSLRVLGEGCYEGDECGECSRLREEIKKELGDVLWYVAAMATELGLCLEEIAQGNLAKLASRADRGLIHGSGDNR